MTKKQSSYCNVGTHLERGGEYVIFLTPYSIPSRERDPNFLTDFFEFVAGTVR